MTTRPLRATNPTIRPLRIAVVAACPFPTLQGSQVLIRQHAEALAERGHAVHIVAYHLGLPLLLPTRESGAWSEGARMRLHRIPRMPLYKRLRACPSAGKPLLDVLLMLTLFTVAARERVDVIHAHHVEGVTAAWPVARALGKPLVFHVHTLMEGELPAYFGQPLTRRLARLVGRWMDGWLPRLADRTIVLSPEARTAFARLGTPWERLVHLPAGIEDRPAPAAVSADAVRARHGLGSGPLVIYTGNLDPYQGLDDLRRAFVEVRRVVPDAQLVIASHAGPEALRGPASWNAGGLRAVRVRDFDEVAALLAASDVAVCPRPACLGFPIKLLNYMAAGKAIVCAAGSARNIAHLDNGYVYPDDDAGALADGLIRLLCDPALAARLGRNALRTAGQLRWSTLAASFEELYFDLLETKDAVDATTGQARPARIT